MPQFYTHLSDGAAVAEFECLPCIGGYVPSDDQSHCVPCTEEQYAAAGSVECLACKRASIPTDDRSGCRDCSLITPQGHCLQYFILWVSYIVIQFAAVLALAKHAKRSLKIVDITSQGGTV